MVIILHIRLRCCRIFRQAAYHGVFHSCLILRGVTDDIVHTRREEIPHYLCNMTKQRRRRSVRQNHRGVPVILRRPRKSIRSRS
ncbi:hypothetical protein KCP74_21095 [Salmonella enterica subsp. enterica]|nr:hypothetical protein KCP74_21095 [Salmonella enterica subsp. enterica]